MNKYERAIFILCGECYRAKRHDGYNCDKINNRCSHIKTLDELVEKATPKKTKIIEDWYSCCYECPNCGDSFWCDGDEQEHKYCFNCGQAIDWSEEE